MAQITRPTKQGGATTYQGKVSAGYTTILASEMDADLDAIYSAWNTGVDGSNIRPGVITGGMLAPGAVGSRELADGGIQTVDIGDGQVTTPKIADGNVTAGKLVGGGVMGGDLTGTYPNPSLGVIQAGSIRLGTGAQIYALPHIMGVSMNEVGTSGADATKPSWVLQLNPDSDAFMIYRAPPGSSTLVLFGYMDSVGKLHVTLADSGVTRTQLAVNAIYGQSAFSNCPASYTLSSPVGSWVTYMTLAPITTRGGNVMLVAQHNLSVSGTGGQFVAQRWLRGATPLQERANLVATSFVPLPGVVQFDAPAAGTYAYAMQLWLGTGVTIQSTVSTQGFLNAQEIG